MTGRDELLRRLDFIIGACNGDVPEGLRQLRYAVDSALVSEADALTAIDSFESGRQGDHRPFWDDGGLSGMQIAIVEHGGIAALDGVPPDAERVRVTANGASDSVTGDLLPTGYVFASDVRTQIVEWLWHRRIPKREITGAAAVGGAGKSTTFGDLVTRTTRGTLGDLPGSVDAPTEPRGAVILTTEEDPSSVVVPRLKAMGADLNRVVLLGPQGVDDEGEPIAPLTFPSGVETLRRLCRACNAGLLTIDTGQAFLDDHLNGNSDKDVRKFYAPLARVAQEFDLSALVALHLSTDRNAPARDRVQGNAAWVNVPRSVLILGPPPGQDIRLVPERIVVGEKGNLGDLIAPAVAMRIVSRPVVVDEGGRTSVGAIEWGDEQAGIVSDDVLRVIGDDECHQVDECEDALRAYLGSDAKPAADVETFLRSDEGGGFTKTTIRSARVRCGITRKGGGITRSGIGADSRVYWSVATEPEDA